MLETLKRYCSLHATPGDEEAVFEALRADWRAQGLDVRTLGRYAVLAQPGERKKSDTLLLVAHADSPGFSVESVQPDGEATVIPLGGIRQREPADLTLKCADGPRPARLERPPAPAAPWLRGLPLRVTFPGPCPALRKGDRLCWAPFWEAREGRLTTPFLDNRAGCALVAAWHGRFAESLPGFNVVVAATAMEEVNGFGAAILAQRVQADAVIVLDATYASAAQGIALGRGPVLTLSDASCILPPALRDRLLACGAPLQTEVYNFSGTDARAFPTHGATCPVIPLLLPTEGNHSPRETCAVADLEAWPAAVAAVARTLFEPAL